jgi:hypothetical protein
MKLICASCRRRWTPKKGEKRTESCPGCRHRNLSSAILRAWDRRKRLEAPAGAIPADGPDAPGTLEELMRAADLASAKALAAALSVAQRGLKGNPD